MILPVLKRQIFLWGYTLATLIFLLAVGFLGSQLITESSLQVIFRQLDSLPLFLFRGLMYGVLLFFWPRLIQWLASRRYAATQVITIRRPLIILIVCYELLIVQNPVALLFKWLG